MPDDYTCCLDEMQNVTVTMSVKYFVVKEILLDLLYVKILDVNLSIAQLSEDEVYYQVSNTFGQDDCFS